MKFEDSNFKEGGIYNEDLFGPVTNKTVVIAIQVHDRIQYLRWVFYLQIVLGTNETQIYLGI